MLGVFSTCCWFPSNPEPFPEEIWRVTGTSPFYNYSKELFQRHLSILFPMSRKHKLCTKEIFEVCCGVGWSLRATRWETCRNALYCTIFIKKIQTRRISQWGLEGPAEGCQPGSWGGLGEGGQTGRELRAYCKTPSRVDRLARLVAWIQSLEPTQRWKERTNSTMLSSDLPWLYACTQKN